MPRGGARPNSGSPPSWKHGRTTTIRVPRVLAVQIVQLARQLDEGKLESDTGSNFESDTDSKVAEVVEILNDTLKFKSNASFLFFYF